MNKNIPWIVTAFLTLLLWLQTCRVQNLKEKAQDSKLQITQLELDKQTLKTIVNNQGKEIETQKVIVTSSKEAINNLTDSIFDLKKRDSKNIQTIAYLKLHQKVRIDSVLIPIERPPSIIDRLKISDSIMAICRDVIDAIDSVTIQVPAVARYADSNLAMKATISKEGLQVDSLVIHDQLNIRFIEHKGGLFKPKTIEVQFFHTNPYFDTEKANSVIYKPKKKSFAKRVLLPVAAGVTLGLLISK